MKAIITLNHGDGVSGMTIMDDGTKAFWTEGRSSDVVMLRPSGEVETAWVSDDSHPVVASLNTDEYGVQREMNLLETHEHDMMRNFGEKVGRVGQAT